MAGMCVKIWLVFLKRECALLNVVRLFLNNFATLEINCIKVLNTLCFCHIKTSLVARIN